MKYKVFAALSDEENDGWVWIKRPEIPSRSVVRIVCGNRTLYCQIRQIEQNFLDRYNHRPRRPIRQPATGIVISAWYRDALGGCAPGDEIELTITKLSRARQWLTAAQVRAACQHPDLAVRLGTRLGVLGVVLALLGIWVGLDPPGFGVEAAKATPKLYSLLVLLATAAASCAICRGPKLPEPPPPPDEAAKSKVAILGWGSLRWDERGGFALHHGAWFDDGPTLKLEFSRISSSRQGALTLVIDPLHGEPTTVSYTLSDRNRKTAIGDLRRREGTTVSNIGYIIRGGDQRSRDAEAAEAIRVWAEHKQIDQVIWTDLPSNFQDKQGQDFSLDAAIAYLNTLEGPAAAEAIDYIAFAPKAADTPLRRALHALGWQVDKSDI